MSSDCPMPLGTELSSMLKANMLIANVHADDVKVLQVRELYIHISGQACLPYHGSS